MNQTEKFFSKIIEYTPSAEVDFANEEKLQIHWFDSSGSRNMKLNAKPIENDSSEITLEVKMERHIYSENIRDEMSIYPLLNAGCRVELIPISTDASLGCSAIISTKMNFTITDITELMKKKNKEPFIQSFSNRLPELWNKIDQAIENTFFGKIQL